MWETGIVRVAVRGTRSERIQRHQKANEQITIDDVSNTRGGSQVRRCAAEDGE
jgi:hypothetical protein